MRQSHKFLLVTTLSILLFLLWSCAGPKAEKPNAQKPGFGNAPAGNPGSPPADLAKNDGPSNKPGPGKIPPFLKKTDGLEKYDSSSESCKAYCQQWCPKAAKCKVKILSNVAACKKLCYDPCQKGMLPKKLGDCLVKADKCTEIKTCFADLRKEVQSLNANADNAPGQPEPAADPGVEKAGPDNVPGATTP